MKTNLKNLSWLSLMFLWMMWLTFGINTGYAECQACKGKEVSTAGSVKPGNVISGTNLSASAKNDPALAAQLKKDVGDIDPQKFYTQGPDKKWVEVGKQISPEDAKVAGKEEGDDKDPTKKAPDKNIPLYEPSDPENTTYDAKTGAPLEVRNYSNETYKDGVMTDQYGNKSVYTQPPSQTGYEFYDPDGNLVYSMERTDDMIQRWNMAQGNIAKADLNNVTVFEKGQGGMFNRVNVKTGVVDDGYLFPTPATQGKDIYIPSMNGGKVYYGPDGKFKSYSPPQK